MTSKVNGSISTVIESINRIGRLDDLAHAEIFLTFSDGMYSIDPYTFPVLLFEDFWLNAKVGSEVVLSMNNGTITGVTWAK